MQAVGHGKNAMDVTCYRTSEKDTLQWKDTLAGSLGSPDCYLLRYTLNRWGVYDRSGAFLSETANAIRNHVSEVERPVDVCRAEIEQAARDFLMNDDLSLIACAESHEGASAADHSNLGVVCRRMIIEARPRDLPHVFIVESRQWPCRVTSVLADLGRLSSDMKDVFIDRRQWLENSWPLFAQHHLDVVADRLVKVRSAYFGDIIENCGAAAGLSFAVSLGLRSAWTLASPGVKYKGAKALVEVLQDGMQFRRAKPEQFSEEIINERGKDAIKAFRKAVRP